MGYFLSSSLYRIISISLLWKDNIYFKNAIPEACGIGTGTADLFGRATLARPNNEIPCYVKLPPGGARPNRPVVLVPMLHASDMNHYLFIKNIIHTI